MTEIRHHYRTCNICEAMCGLDIAYRGKEILSIRPDKDDPFSQGHICPKARALDDFYNDPDRLQRPLRRSDGGWEEIGWKEAMAEIGENIRRIQAEHGQDSVGIYLGNPNAHNIGNPLFLPAFFKAVGTRNRFSSASADQLPHHVAANYMFGAGMVIPVPDIDRTDFMLIIGANPAISNGSMMTAAGAAKRIQHIRKRGGRVVVIDPRHTETARLADEHLFIRPEKDALLLLAMIHTIFAEKLADPGRLEDVLDGYEELAAAAADFPAESVAQAVGIESADIRRLARDFAGAPSAVCYSRMGASTQSFGALCLWLTNALNIITGNFDREGGAMFPLPAFDLLARTPRGKPSSYGRYASRVSGLPYNNSEFPVAALAEEITTEGEGQLRALFTVAGNPVLSAPGGDALDEAFGQLDYMVSVDIYVNDTTRHANIILPATHGLEVPHFDVFFNSFAVRNTVKYSPPLFEKTGDQKPDWQILKLLIGELSGAPGDDTTPEMILDGALRAGPYRFQGMSLQKLIDYPHGIDLGPLKPCLEHRIRTEDGRIRLAPRIFLDDLQRLKAQATRIDREAYPFDLIGRRLAISHNTWTQNAHRLVKGSNPVTLQVNSQDAESLGIAKGQVVAVRSATGRIEIEVDVNDGIMPGVVSMPQGWGHGRAGTRMSVAATQPGASINSLTDAGRIDPVSGNAAFNGTPVAIELI